MMEKKMGKAVAPLVVALLFSVGCSGMSNTQQRVLSGGAVGATGGAIIGAVAGSAALGAATGGGAGLLGGYVYDQYQKSRGNL
jgi:osmotically inducible lipoprotein OsmB